MFGTLQERGGQSEGTEWPGSLLVTFQGAYWAGIGGTLVPKECQSHRSWWHTPLTPALGRQTQGDLCQLGLYSALQAFWG